MMFFFKKPKVVLDCFTYSEAVAMAAPIQKASAYLPEWWKNLSGQYYEDNNKLLVRTTSKLCPGIIDYYTNSIALPTWCEFKIAPNPDGSYSWVFPDQETTAIVHPIAQYEGFVDRHEFGHIKIESPWIFMCKENINWMWSQPTYNFGTNMDKIFILPGVNNYSQNVTVSVNMMINVKQPSLIEVGVNEPLVHITPLTERQVEIKRHVITEQEFDRLRKLNRRTTFVNSSKKTAKLREENKECPYTGGSK